ASSQKEVAMCRGGRLVADFVAGTDIRPGLSKELEEHVTLTADDLWVVWAYKLAWQFGDLFVPLSGGSSYPADARATCRLGRAHDAPNPRCTCGFHALSNRGLPGLPAGLDSNVLTVALSGTGAGLRVARLGSAMASRAADGGSRRDAD